MTADGLPLLLYGDSYRFPDIYHATRFLAPDAFIALEQEDEIVMFMNSLEATQRATEEAWAEGVAAIRRADIGTDRCLRLDGEIFTAERLARSSRARCSRAGASPSRRTRSAPARRRGDRRTRGAAAAAAARPGRPTRSP